MATDSNATIQKKNIFKFFFVQFLKSASNFEHCQIKDDLHTLPISEIMYCEWRR